MKTYRVMWEIDIEAEDPDEACRRALEIQRDPESTATVFQVILNTEGDIATFDLTKE